MNIIKLHNDKIAATILILFQNVAFMFYKNKTGFFILRVRRFYDIGNVFDLGFDLRAIYRK